MAEYGYNLCFAVEPPRRFFSSGQKNPNFWTLPFFKKVSFRRKLDFLGYLFGEISHKSCSYGPYGPFRFSEKHEM